MARRSEAHIHEKSVTASNEVTVTAPPQAARDNFNRLQGFRRAVVAQLRDFTRLYP